MPTYTPLANPVVSAPAGAAEELPAGPPEELRAPVVVITPVGEFQLSRGSLLIGRLPECDVLLEGELVSRMHARISVQGSDVVLEDLHSTNGVLVNGLKVSHSRVLCRGDRVLVGTSELTLLELRESTPIHTRSTLAPSSRADELPTRPPPRGRKLASVASEAGQQSPLPAQPSSAEPPAGVQQVPTTTRAGALQMLGELAERMALVGKFEQAAELLAGHLKRVLKGANSGLTVTPEVAQSASLHALRVARWTKLPLWADYAVELHLSARLPMSLATLQAYEVTIAAMDFDRLLLAYYVESLAPRLPDMSPVERLRVEHLARLARDDR